VLVQPEMESGRSPLASIARASAGGGLGSLHRLILEVKGQLARKRRILNPGCAAYFNGDYAPGIGTVRMPSGRVAHGLGRSASE
jgi:hypothetical protein